MSEDRQIVSQVYEAKTDSDAADRLVRQYMGFIKAETGKFSGRVAVEGRDDELSIAMLAFYETILAYDKSRGAFLPLAAIAIRNRLIDFVRRESRCPAVSCDTPPADGAVAVKDTLSDENDRVAGSADRLSAQKEIAEFAARLADFGLTLSDVADNCPRQERTMAACLGALEWAKANKRALSELEKTKKLPLAEISAGSGVARKTLERHRKYLVAIMLAYTNGFEIIREHLKQMKGGTRQ